MPGNSLAPTLLAKAWRGLHETFEIDHSRVQVDPEEPPPALCAHQTRLCERQSENTGARRERPRRSRTARREDARYAYFLSLSVSFFGV
jgi:hypothetical protein